MEIRELMRQDIEQVLRLYVELMPDTLERPFPEAAFERLRNDPDTHIMVAVEGETVLGTAMGIVCRGLVDTFMVFEDVVVREDARGKGVGSKLIGALDETAVRQGCGYAFLVSSAFRKKAHVFYEKCGFEGDARGFKKRYK